MCFKYGVQGRYRFFSKLPAVLTAVAPILSFAAKDTRAQSGSCGDPLISKYHFPQCNASGKLVPWNIDESGPFDYIMKIESRWWLNAPNFGGWPTYLTGAELDRNYLPVNGALPASTV